MNFVEEWIATARSVIESPTGFFSTESRRDGFEYPLRFAVVSILASAVLGAIGSLVFPAAGYGRSIVAAGSVLAGGLLLGVLGLLVGAGIVHVFVYFLGGEKGYRETLAVACYATALSPIAAVVSLIPLLGWLLGVLIQLYGLFIYWKGLEEFQEMESAKAALAVILPIVILGVLMFILFAVLAVLAVFVTGVSTG